MKHPRQLIREAAAAMLLGKTDAQDRVYTSRYVPWRREQLPGIAVYTIEESSGADDLAGNLARTLTLAVLAVVTLDADVDTALDDIALQIESKMGADATLGGTAFGSVLTGTGIEITEDQGRPIGVVRLSYDVEYRTTAASA